MALKSILDTVNVNPPVLTQSHDSIKAEDFLTDKFNEKIYHILIEYRDLSLTSTHIRTHINHMVYETWRSNATITRALQ